MLTCSALVDRYLSWLAGQVEAGRSSPKTLNYYRTQLRYLLQLLPPDLPAAAICPHHLLDGPDTWHFHQATRRVFTWATKVRFLAADPLQGHQLPPPGRRERTPSPVERSAILAATTEFFRRYLTVLWMTAARPGELRALRWCDLDLLNGTAELDEFKSKKRMKAPPPSRTIYLDEAAVELLRAWKAEAAPRPFDRVFTGRYGQPLTSQAVVLNFKRACTRAGIDQEGERLVAYSFRHGRATELHVDGLDLHTLSNVLGHTQTKTTNRYLHPRKRDIRQKLLDVTRRKKPA